MRSILDESIFRQAIIDNDSLATLSSIVHKVVEQESRIIIKLKQEKTGETAKTGQKTIPRRIRFFG